MTKNRHVQPPKTWVSVMDGHEKRGFGVGFEIRNSTSYNLVLRLYTSEPGVTIKNSQLNIQFLSATWHRHTHVCNSLPAWIILIVFYLKCHCSVFLQLMQSHQLPQSTVRTQYNVWPGHHLHLTGLIFRLFRNVGVGTGWFLNLTNLWCLLTEWNSCKQAAIVVAKTVILPSASQKNKILKKK